MQMKKRSNLNLMAAGLALGLGLMPAADAAPKTTGAKPSDKDRVSYALGVDVATNFKRLGIEVNLKEMVKGLEDEYAGKKLAISEEELKTLMTDFQRNLSQKAMEKQKAISDGNKTLGDAFRAEYAKKEGVTSLPSGLMYRVIKAGDGQKPGENDRVECNYRGTLIDGKEFDSSARQGHPVQFALQTIIPGWREALKLMPTGSKWELVIPPELAYGPRGAGREIGPNATLMFEIELIKVLSDEKPPEAGASAPAK